LIIYSTNDHYNPTINTLSLHDALPIKNTENITPVIRSEKLNDQVRGLLDAVSARLSTQTVTELVGKVVIDGQSVAAVAREFLGANGLVEQPPVGSTIP